MVITMTTCRHIKLLHHPLLHANVFNSLWLLHQSTNVNGDQIPLEDLKHILQYPTLLFLLLLLHFDMHNYTPPNFILNPEYRGAKNAAYRVDKKSQYSYQIGN